MNIDDLRETAQLAHLPLGDEEIARAYPAFEQMLGYFAAMEAADKDSAAFPEGSSADTDSRRVVESAFFRKDEPNPNNAHNSSSTGLNITLVGNAGERDGRFIVVPNVL